MVPPSDEMSEGWPPVPAADGPIDLGDVGEGIEQDGEPGISRRRIVRGAAAVAAAATTHAVAYGLGAQARGANDAQDAKEQLPILIRDAEGRGYQAGYEAGYQAGMLEATGK